MGTSSWIEYLNDPHLVARFQKYFGIQTTVTYKSTSKKQIPAEEVRLSPRSSSSLPKNYTITPSLTNENLRDRSKSRGAQKSRDDGFLDILSDASSSGISSCGSATNSSTSLSTNASSGNEYDEDEDEGDEALTTAETSYTIGNRFWYYLFCFGSALGDEVFYACFFPFWFWNIDGAVCRRVVLIWGFLMYIGKNQQSALVRDV
jgi:hypothetical protein